MDIKYDYDESNPKSIEAYAGRLLGMTFRDVIESNSIPNQDIENRRKKGNLGQIIEQYHFHYEINSDSNPDFSKAGVELKVTPYRINKDGSLVAKERLILTMINYEEIVKESFEKGHFWHKSRLLLIVAYLFDKDIKQTLDYKIHYASLFTPPEQDLVIIRHDYETILGKSITMQAINQ